MLSDLAALTPPLIVGAAFLIGVLLFLRRQMSPSARSADGAGERDIQGDGNTGPDGASGTTTDSEGRTSSDTRHSTR